MRPDQDAMKPSNLPQQGLHVRVVTAAQRYLMKLETGEGFAIDVGRGSHTRNSACLSKNITLQPFLNRTSPNSFLCFQPLDDDGLQLAYDN